MDADRVLGMGVLAFFCIKYGFRVRKDMIQDERCLYLRCFTSVFVEGCARVHMLL